MANLLGLDNCIEKIDSKGICVRFKISKSEQFLEGHFPGNPVFPGILTIEVAMQAIKTYLKVINKCGRCIEIVSSRFLKKILEDDIILCECIKTENDNIDYCSFSVECLNQNSAIVAQLSVIYQTEIVDKNVDML